MSDFVGRGPAFFPMAPGTTGGLALLGGDRKLEQSMRLILETAPGERPMRPEFGCRIHDHVFAPADGDTAGTIAHEVRAALLRWEPRVDVTDVVVSSAPDAPTLWIDISYVVKGTNDPRNLVFPFYVIPIEE